MYLAHSRNGRPVMYGPRIPLFLIIDLNSFYDLSLKKRFRNGFPFLD